MGSDLLPTFCVHLCCFRFSQEDNFTVLLVQLFKNNKKGLKVCSKCWNIHWLLQADSIAIAAPLGLLGSCLGLRSARPPPPLRAQTALAAGCRGPW